MVNLANVKQCQLSDQPTDLCTCSLLSSTPTVTHYLILLRPKAVTDSFYHPTEGHMLHQVKVISATYMHSTIFTDK